MRGRRLLGGVLAGFLLAAVGLVGISLLGVPGGGVVGGGCGNGSARVSLVSVTADLHAGESINSNNWQAVSTCMPTATANLYFKQTDTSLFLGKTVQRNIPNGNFLAKTGDIVPPNTASYSVVPIKFEVAPDGLSSGDSVCIYAVNGAELEIFYPVPLVVNTAGKNWQATIPPSKAPAFLYANALGINLAAFGTPSSGVCPTQPIGSAQQAINIASGGSGTGP